MGLDLESDFFFSKRESQRVGLFLFFIAIFLRDRVRLFFIAILFFLFFRTFLFGRFFFGSDNFGFFCLFSPVFLSDKLGFFRPVFLTDDGSTFYFLSSRDYVYVSFKKKVLRLCAKS